MSPTFAVDRPYKDSYIQVDITRADNDAFVAGYTNRDASVNSGGNNYPSFIDMSVEFAKNTAALDAGELETKVRLPVDGDAFLTKLGKGHPFPILNMRVRELVEGVNPGDLSSTLTWVWGLMVGYVKNRPKRGWMELIVRPDKCEMDTPAGLICLGQCRNTLFTPPCAREGVYGPSLNTNKRTALVNSAVFQIMNVNAYTAIAAPKTFQRGYAEFDGARITIADWAPGSPNAFFMAEAVPPTWVGQTVTLVPGCNRSIEACRLQWANEEAFNGAGYVMPNDSPVTDLGR